jgi:hypothetical protein
MILWDLIPRCVTQEGSLGLRMGIETGETEPPAAPACAARLRVTAPGSDGAWLARPGRPTRWRAI